MVHIRPFIFSIFFSNTFIPLITHKKQIPDTHIIKMRFFLRHELTKPRQIKHSGIAETQIIFFYI